MLIALRARLTESLSSEATFSSRALFGLLLALLGAGLLWVLNIPANVHPDERLYTDAALQMVRTGDYWTPTYPDGRPRLVKPILTYWALTGSFHAFGINLFTSRLASAFAGVLVVCLTFQLARAVTNCRRTSFVAAAIIAANIKLLITATRATPDVFLCLFTLLSLWGFARILFLQDQSFLGPLLAFGGTGLAVQTKGLLGVWPLATVAVFWLVGKPARGFRGKLLQWPAIALGIFLAVFWYIVMLHRHGSGALQDFFQDQVGTRVSRNPLSMLANVAAYLVTGLQHFLPWTLLLMAIGLRQRTALAAFWRDHRRQMLFALIPFVLLTAVLSFGTVRAQRYLSSAFPMLAVLFAMVLVNIPLNQQVWSWVRGLGWLAAALTILIGASLSILGTIGCELLIPAGAALLAVGIAGIMALRSGDRTWCWVWIAALISTTFVVDRASLQSLLSPQALPPLAKTLLQQNSPGTPIYTWQVRPSRAGLLRLLTEGKFPIGQLKANGELPDFSGAQLVVTTSPDESLFRQAGYDVVQIAAESSTCAPIQDLAHHFWPGKAKKAVSARETYWLATQGSRKTE